MEERAGLSWDDLAGWYADLVGAGWPQHDTASAALRTLLPSVAGATILDLACGQGFLSHELAAQGATVTGVDLTAALLDHAQQRTPPKLAAQVTFIHDDAQTLARIDADRFDGVVCNLALMDIPDLNAAVAQTARVLKPGGWFAFTLTHPCFLAPHADWTEGAHGQPARVIGSYLKESFWRSDNPEGVRRVGSYHRPLSTYVAALKRGGLIVEDLIEVAGNEALIAMVPGYADIPPFLGIRARLPALS